MSVKQNNHVAEHDDIAHDEFMFRPVPQNQRRSTYAQIMVWVGFGYVVTGLFVGGVLAGIGEQPGLKPWEVLVAIVLGMGALFLITSFLGIVAQRTGLNLSMLSRYTYGAKGMAIPMALMGLMTLGWFSSIVGMVGDIWGSFIGNPSGITIMDPEKFGFDFIPVTLEAFIAIIFWGLVFTYTAVKGISAIEKVSKVVGPIILLIVIVMGFVMVNQGGGWSAFIAKANAKGGLGIGSGVNVLVGSWIAGAVMGVDLFRFNKSISAVWWGAAACFIITNPILNIVGYISTLSIGDFNYIVWMIQQSMIVAIIGVFCWTVSLWTTDQSELYCNSLYLGPIFNAMGAKRVNRKKIVIVVGVLGTIIGALGVYQMFFADFINLLGAMAPPLCAPILADYFVTNRGNSAKYDPSTLDKQPNFRFAGIFSFGIGAVLGYLFQYQIPVPFNLPSGLLAMIVSFIIYILIYKLTPDRQVDEQLIAEVQR